PCNKFLYVSNRGFNGISAFRINEETGSLSLINHYSSHGDFPRDFEISPCNKFLIIANEKSDNLTIYLKNPDGTLKLFKNDIFIPSPTCIKFK
ncbi:MAG: beta-propeller fold lactonase family protein, partial [Intestinibacter bartlettii]